MDAQAKEVYHLEINHLFSYSDGLKMLKKLGTNLSNLMWL